MVKLNKIRYKLVDTNLFRVAFNLLVTIYLYVYLIITIYLISSISRSIYTDIRFEDKFESSPLFAISVCFDLNETKFYDKFCNFKKFGGKKCENFSVSLTEEREKYDINDSFDENIRRKENEASLDEIFYEWSELFCVKYESKTTTINRFMFSINMCSVDLSDLVIRIYAHETKKKPDLIKDYVYKYSFNQEKNYSEINVVFEKTVSILLEKPYWTECKQYSGNFTRGECIDKVIYYFLNNNSHT